MEDSRDSHLYVLNDYLANLWQSRLDDDLDRDSLHDLFRIIPSVFSVSRKDLTWIIVNVPWYWCIPHTRWCNKRTIHLVTSKVRDHPSMFSYSPRVPSCRSRTGLRAYMQQHKQLVVNGGRGSDGATVALYVYSQSKPWRLLGSYASRVSGFHMMERGIPLVS